jgi:hypothetical protein
MMKYLRPALLLLVTAILAYGLLIPKLGFYWDDLPISWIRYELGPAALAEYFSAKRPAWSYLYQITSTLLPQLPVYWQIFALLWRWAGALILYILLERLLPQRSRMALGIALLFLVYPGFDQHFASYLYSHFYIVLFFFLFSLLCTVLAYQSPKRYWLWTGIGLFFSALNMWMMEYFFVQELMRAGIILMELRQETLTSRERVQRVFRLWWPYLALFFLAILSRLFVSNNQDYPFVFFDQLRSAPAAALTSMLGMVALTIRLVTVDAWLRMFTFSGAGLPASALKYYSIVVSFAILITGLGILFLPRGNQATRQQYSDGLWVAGLGVFTILLSGWSFWLIDFVPSLEWPASRFTLSFMLGVSLLFGGLISLIPWESVRIIAFVLLVAMAVGKQYLTAQEHVQDWETQKKLFWQMTWRAPGIQPDTLVLLNEGGLKYYADNSLSAALNWIYAPQTQGRHIPYALFYPTTRLRNALPKMEPGIPVHFDYIAGEFNGNTSQILSMYYAPPGCLRVLDPEIERVNRSIREPSLMRFASRLTNLDLITEEPQAQMPEAYGPEPEHDYCYNYEKADLARQMGDWDTVVKMAEAALTIRDYPHDPAELMAFIEGYAHTGEWNQAMKLSQEAYRAGEQYAGPMLCRLWERIETETTDSPEQAAAISEAVNLFACNP